MSTILQAREDIIKKLNVMSRRIQGVTTFILMGSKRCPPSDIHVVIGTDDFSTSQKIYNDINFLISEFLLPSSFNYMEADNRIINNYSFDSGVGTEVIVCGEDNFPAADWWVSYLDTNGAAQAFYGDESKCAADPVKDEPAEESDDSADDFTDDFDDDLDDDLGGTPDIEPEDPPVEQPAQTTLNNDDNDDFYNKIDNEFQAARDKLTFAVPNAEPSASGIMDGENSDDFTANKKLGEEAVIPSSKEHLEEIWGQIYGKAALAKGAIAGGLIIRAGEVVNELRTQLIELICNQNGITQDYINSIDLLPNDCQKALAKTYPSKLESSAMISALAAELSLFEQLIK